MSGYVLLVAGICLIIMQDEFCGPPCDWGWLSAFVRKLKDGTE